MTEKENKTVEVLAPAGSFQIMKAAFDAGADAVYAGTDRFSARSFAKNFSAQEMLDAVDYAHLIGRKVYLTVNILLKEYELQEELFPMIAPLYERGLDAVIVQDLGVVRFLHEHFPLLPIHASTQMSITSAAAAELLAECGVTRVVPARELSLAEIVRIKEETGLEVECFVHGAMCYAYSGKCLFSSSYGERSGNRGSCGQPCRHPYRIENKKPQYLLSMYDMCALPEIERLIGAGISSFKIEGRMKDADYVTAVTRLYRKYVDLFARDHKLVTVTDRDIQTASLYARNITGTGYYFKRSGPDMITPDDPSFKMRGGENGDEGCPPALTRVDVSATFKAGLPAEMKLSCRGSAVIAFSDQPVEAARKAPLSEEKTARQLCKSDPYPFDIHADRLDLDGPVFMPVSQINEMRRQGLSSLANELLKPFRRKGAENSAQSLSATSAESACHPRSGVHKLHVLVSTYEQWKSALADPRIDLIYVESHLIHGAQEAESLIGSARSSEPSKKIALALPHIFREFDTDVSPWVFEVDNLKTVARFDGVLARNLDSVVWLKNHGFCGKIHADHLLYAFNSQSIAYLNDSGVSSVCYPLEMNRYDIAGVERTLRTDDVLEQMFGREILVYGYAPRMISAQCVRKNTAGCSHQSGIVELTDRKGVQFKIQNICDSCYNIVYNSVPNSLHQSVGKIAEIGRIDLRMDFTFESVSEMSERIDAVTGAADAGYAYTKGHFDKGVL